ncbi:MAG: hypothetical protein J6A99_04770 [Clostridia bacterium]|nr:hypothetical protein [Clostridia bacterium]
MKLFQKKDNKQREEIFARLKKLHVDLTGTVMDDISPKSKIDAIGLTSLGKVQFICMLEDEFNVEVPNVTLFKLKTVDDMIDFVIKSTNGGKK